MTVVLGKRKRRAPIKESHAERPSEQNAEDDHLQQLLRQHFETTFEPLEIHDSESEHRTSHEEIAEGGVSDSDWSGISAHEEEANALVVDYRNLNKTRADVSREELKLFMVIHDTSP